MNYPPQGATYFDPSDSDSSDSDSLNNTYVVDEPLASEDSVDDGGPVIIGDLGGDDGPPFFDLGGDGGPLIIGDLDGDYGPLSEDLGGDDPQASEDLDGDVNKFDFLKDAPPNMDEYVDGEKQNIFPSNLFQYINDNYPMEKFDTKIKIKTLYEWRNKIKSFTNYFQFMLREINKKLKNHPINIMDFKDSEYYKNDGFRNLSKEWLHFYLGESEKQIKEIKHYINDEESININDLNYLNTTIEILEHLEEEIDECLKAENKTMSSRLNTRMVRRF